MAVAFNRNATDPAGVASSGGVTTYSNAGAGFSIGTAAVNRWVYVLVGAEVASNPNSATIDYGAGAVAMTAGTLSTFGSMRTRIFKAHAPTGTVATIAITWSAAVLAAENHISIYAVTGHNPSQDVGSASISSTDMDSNAPLTTGSISIVTGGGFLAVAAGAVDTVAKTWANATEDLDVDAGGFRHTTATRTTALTTTAVTCTGASNNEDGCLSYVIFKPGRDILAATTSFAFTGSTASLERDYEVAADAGSFAFTGSNVTLREALSPLSADSGAFTFTGAETVRDLEFVPSSGSFTFTGQTADFTISDLVAGAGSFAFTGGDAFSDIGINAAAGSFAFTGSDATLVYSDQGNIDISAGSGTFVFTGAETVRDLEFVPSSGSFTFTGQTASFEWTGAQGLAADPGSFSFSGQTASLKWDHEIAAEGGTFTFSGTAATVVAHQHLRPESDVSISQWTDQAGGTTNLFATVDEVTANDADYVKSPNLQAGSDTLELMLNATTAPVLDINHALRVRFRKQNVGAGVTMDFTFALVQGTTVIASSTVPNVGTSFVNAELGLSEVEAASITNYADLRVRLTAAVA